MRCTNWRTNPRIGAMAKSLIRSLTIFVILLSYPLAFRNRVISATAVVTDRLRLPEINSTRSLIIGRRRTLSAGVAGDVEGVTVPATTRNSTSDSEFKVAYLTVASDLVFDGRLMTVEVSSDDSQTNDDRVQKTFIFDVWNVYKSPPVAAGSDHLARWHRRIAVTFVCSQRHRLHRGLHSSDTINFRPRDLSGDVQSSSTSSRYREWCEAEADSSLADVMYVVFASVSTGKDSSEPTRKYLATGPPEPSTEGLRRRVDYYSQLKHASKPTRVQLSIGPQQADQGMQVGDRFQLMCRISGRPSPRVVWLKDGVPVKPDSNNGMQIFNIRRHSVLSKPHVDSLDAGTYRCVASNVFGSSRSGPVHVTVRSLPDTRMAHSNLCDEHNFCLHGGICYWAPKVNTRFCNDLSENDDSLSALMIGGRSQIHGIHANYQCRPYLFAAFGYHAMVSTDPTWIRHFETASSKCCKSNIIELRAGLNQDTTRMNMASVC